MDSHVEKSWGWGQPPGQDTYNRTCSKCLLSAAWHYRLKVCNLF